MGRSEDGWLMDKRRTTSHVGCHEPVAAAMILYRKLPAVNQYLAYAPRGIVTDYTNAEQLKSVFATLKMYLKSKNTFGLKIGRITMA